MTRYKWIDQLRGVAIMAVVIDHALGFFPHLTSQTIRMHTFFSVYFFIILSGASNTLALNRQEFIFPGSAFIFWWKRGKSLLVPYLFASVIYYFSAYQEHSWPQFIYLLVNFRIEPMFYFVMVLLELYLVFPLLYLCYRKISQWYLLMIAVLGIIFLSYKLIPIYRPPWTFLITDYPVFIPYLLPFIAGMIIIKKLPKTGWLTYLLSLVTFMLMGKYAFDPNFGFLGTIPNLYQVIWSILLVLLIYRILKFNIHTHLVIRILAFLGKHSMFIYLFHFLFLFKAATLYPQEKGVIFFSLTILSAILFSLIIEYIYKSVIRLLGQSFIYLFKDRKR